MNLKKYRVLAGFTQAEIADKLGMPTKTYQNYEREVREPDSEVLCKLADIYDVSLDDLMGRFDYELISLDPEEEMRWRKIRAQADLFRMLYLALDEERQKELLDFAKYLASKDEE